MIFVIEYDRSAGKLVEMQTFSNGQRSIALEVRLAREIALQRLGQRHEVVVLEAATEADLRATHRRYFEDVGSLTRAAS